jgi:hypothetical protein
MQLFVGLGNGGDIREVRVPDDLTGFIELSEGHQNRCLAFLGDAFDGGPVGGRGLVVQIDFAALQGQIDRAPAFEAEGGGDVGFKQIEGHQGGDVQAGGADAAELEGLIPVDEVADALDACFGAGIDDASGAVDHHGFKVLEGVLHRRAPEDPRHHG